MGIHLTHLAILVVHVRLTTEHLLPHILSDTLPHRSISLRVHGHSDQEADLRKVNHVEVQWQRVWDGRSYFTRDLGQQTVDAIVQAAMLVECRVYPAADRGSTFLIGALEVDLLAR